ncbi:hypothetical protein GGR52DRAFT_317116 [Hypoxylon sp. FL1284]|nr:hypothetical protein GGR52DRAFT_317116 [Hypoxylon sp. FL1284]
MDYRNRALLAESVLGITPGLDFKDIASVLCDYGDALLPLTPDHTNQITIIEAHDIVIEKVRQAFLLILKYADVYRRINGNRAFWYLIFTEWNSVDKNSGFNPVIIEKLIRLFVDARSRHTSRHLPSNLGVGLITLIDRFIVMNEISSLSHSVRSRARTKPPSLDPPESITASTLGSRTWPPAHFSVLDVAIMAPATTRAKIFGIDYQHKVDEANMPIYPTDQDAPLDVRNFLCWMSLEETRPNPRALLFLAPVAFMDDQARCEWYRPTGFKARHYATVDEFIEYAREKAKQDKPGTGRGLKRHVIALLTPWFFDAEELAAKATERGQPIPTIWEGECLRAGMMACLSQFWSFTRSGYRSTVRVLIFRPSSSLYPMSNPPPGRVKKQDDWLKEMKLKLENEFEVKKVWVGGRCLHHYGPTRDER